MVRKLKESVYSVTYCYDDEWSGSGCSEEDFEGSWLELQDYISRLKADGCYNINASFLYDDDDEYDESVQKQGKNLKEDQRLKPTNREDIIGYIVDNFLYPNEDDKYDGGPYDPEGYEKVKKAFDACLGIDLEIMEEGNWDISEGFFSPVTNYGLNKILDYLYYKA